MTERPSPVVIGVNGSDRDEAALRAGVEEARRLGVGVRLVHVAPDLVSFSPLVPVTPSHLVGLGEEILTVAQKALREIDHDVEVTTLFAHGSRSHRLTEAAADAPLLVVGRDDRPLPVRILEGNTATAVAATATCPVLAVPEGWGPLPARGRVVVGVKSPTCAVELLDEAFALAAGLGDKLVVLHAWRLPTGYEGLIDTRVAVGEWGEHSRRELDVLAQGSRLAYPDVEVELVVVRDRAVHALIEASRHADAVVLVRQPRGTSPRGHLGSTARAVLHAAQCPVLVVPGADEQSR
ncbi:MAG: universal stress protein [Nocardioides sp.]